MATYARVAATARSTTRRWRRFDIETPVRVTVEKFRHDTVMSSHGSQMNGGGLALLGDPELVIGDEVQIELIDYELRLRGVVRNHAGNYHGVQFVFTTAEEAEHLARFRQVLTSTGGPLYA